MLESSPHLLLFSFLFYLFLSSFFLLASLSQLSHFPVCSLTSFAINIYHSPSLCVCVFPFFSFFLFSLSLTHFCLLHTLISLTLSLSLAVFLSVCLFQLAMLFFLYIYISLCVCVCVHFCVCLASPFLQSFLSFFSPSNLMVYCLNGLNGASKS